MKKEFLKNTIEVFAKTIFHYVPEILKYETIEGNTTWYLSMLEIKLAANNMAVSIMNEMIKMEIKRKKMKLKK